MPGDIRCNCGEADCPICTAPAHQPWTPRAGIDQPPPPPRLTPEEYMRQYRRWEIWQSVRRYLLVLLLTGLGSMIGSAITLYVLLPQFD